METKKNNSTIVIGAVLAIALVAGGVFLFMGDDEATNDSASETSQTAEQEQAAVETDANIVELAQDTPELSTLVDAVVAADLVETLSGEGPFTVFAPTNDAFAALLEDLDVSAEELLGREDLAEILTYHVVSGEVLAADLSDGQKVTTVNGDELTVSVSNDGVTLTDSNDNVSNVTATDISASNGVVHLIDAVVLPQS